MRKASAVAIRGRLAVVAAFAIGPLLALGGVGCRGILGIDEDVPLLTDAAGGGEGGGGGDGGAGDGAPGDGGPNADGPLPEGGDAGLVAVDRRFAQWPLPVPSPLLSNFTLTSDTVTDKTTSLVWQRGDATPPSKSYPDGVAFCGALTIGGQTDWRLPTRIELLSILDYGQASGFVNATVFVPGAQPAATDLMWTDSISLLRAKLDDHFFVDLRIGVVGVASSAQVSSLVRCVRGGPTMTPAIPLVASNGAARDLRTGLLWQLDPIATTMLVADAKNACAALVLGGFSTGWRLPNVRELASLVDESREQVPLLPSAFLPGPALRYWSATTRANPPTANFAVDFGTANIHQDDFASELKAVRCVR